MKDVGIVRRIDELGRIVLPRELRKMYKLDTGTKLQIYVGDDGEIILKKISEIDKNNLHISRCVNALAGIIENDILITDRENIIAASKKKYDSAQLTDEVYEIIKGHDTVIKKRTEGALIVPVVKGLVEEYDCELFVPVIREGDSVGSIIVLAGKGKCFNTDGIKICKAFASLLGLIDD